MAPGRGHRAQVCACPLPRALLLPLLPRHHRPAPMGQVPHQPKGRGRIEPPEPDGSSAGGQRPGPWACSGVSVLPPGCAGFGGTAEGALNQRAACLGTGPGARGSGCVPGPQSITLTAPCPQAGAAGGTLLPSAAPGSQGGKSFSHGAPHVTAAKLDTVVPPETPPGHLQRSPDSPVTALPHTSPTSTGRCCDAATITEPCSGDVPEVELSSLLREPLPRYTLRADTVFGYDHEDWLRAPPGPPGPAAPLTPRQMEETLRYFRECGVRAAPALMAANGITATG
ncbi:collagen alpha-4(IV) chain-like [Pezoporus occidentalis]|uniref:collagen alpha-4(IV) chain-like n=1 Tax=Pezoporus occidentalis TaxID=407982 RepID=UPI002F912D4E